MSDTQPQRSTARGPVDGRARTADAADLGDPAATAARDGGRPDRGMRWWARLLQVLAFHAVVLGGLWWAFHPDTGSSGAQPGVFPTFLIIVAWVLFFLILCQTHARVPVAVLAVVFLLFLPAIWIAAPAAERVYRSTAMERVPDAVAMTSDRLDNGMYRSDFRLPDGSVVKGFAVEQDPDRVRRQARDARTLNPFQLNRGPFLNATVGEPGAVLVDPDGFAYTRTAGRDDGSDEDRRSAMVWLAVTAVLWLPIEAAAVSSLVRRRSWMTRIGEEMKGKSPSERA